MKELTLSASTKDGASASATFQAPENIQEFIDAYGEDIAYNYAMCEFRRAAQAGLRRAAQAGRDAQAWADAWKPGVRPMGLSAEEKLAKKLASLSDEQLQRILEQLKAKKQQTGTDAVDEEYVSDEAY